MKDGTVQVHGQLRTINEDGTFNNESTVTATYPDRATAISTVGEAAWFKDKGGVVVEETEV